MHVTHRKPEPGAPQKGKSRPSPNRNKQAACFLFLVFENPRARKTKASRRERTRTNTRQAMHACMPCQAARRPKATYIRHHRSTIPPHPRAPRVYLYPLDDKEQDPPWIKQSPAREDVPPQNLGAKTRQHPHDRASFTGMVPPPPAAEEIDVG